MKLIGERSKLALRLAETLHGVESLRLALLFGSRARDEARDDSDVDLVVDAPVGSLGTIGALVSEALGQEADVSRLSEATIPVLRELLRDGILVYEARPGTYATWRAHTLIDLETDRPWYDRMRDAWLLRVEKRGLGGQ